MKKNEIIKRIDRLEKQMQALRIEMIQFNCKHKRFVFNKPAIYNNYNKVCSFCEKLFSITKEEYYEQRLNQMKAEFDAVKEEARKECRE